MTDQKRIDKITQQYISSGEVLQETEETGDWRKENKEVEKLTKVFKELEKDGALAEACLPPLLKNENIEVRMKAAQHCLSLGIRVQEAIRTFEGIAADHSKRMYPFRAEMTLRVWRENGFLLVYEGQEIHYNHKAKKR